MSYNLNFHQTFPPTKEYIMRLLEVCDGTPRTKEELSSMTGIPTGKSSGKVEPHIAYAEYMGLLADTRLDGKHCLNLTSLGLAILNEDPGMQEKVSIAVCHARLTSMFGGALLWMAMFKKILYKYPKGISDPLLADELAKVFEQPVKTGPFNSSYDGMFSGLSLIERDNNKLILRNAPINKELLFVYAYALLYEWENKYPGNSEITSNEINSMAMAPTFGFSESTFYSILEELSIKGILHFNRQLAPYTVVKQASSETIISRLYSELC